VLEVRRQMPKLGTRKLYHILQPEFKAQHLRLGRDRLFALLREEGLLVLRKKRYTQTTNSKHWMRKYPNLVKGIDLVRPEQVWVADITYIDTAEGNGYLHLVTDAYSKQIMGYELSKDMATASTLKALKRALKKRQYTDLPLIHHSDRGLQYCSAPYTKELIEHNISISMTQNGDPYENAIAERVNGILKEEFYLGEKLLDTREAQKLSDQSIRTYNNLRPHLSCHMMTPRQMHSQNTIKLKAWNKKARILNQVSELL
jgi:putative transposase